MPRYQIFKLNSRNEPVHIGSQEGSSAQKAIKQFTMGGGLRGTRLPFGGKLIAIPNIRQFMMVKTTDAKGRTTYKKAFGRR